MKSVVKIFDFKVSVEYPKKDIEAMSNLCQRFGKEVRSESRVLEYMIIKEECTKKRPKIDAWATSIFRRKETRNSKNTEQRRSEG